ncbi:tetratricopeptide repeat protein [Rubripirellula sp.]|nr:tetratricopeptide repeat protein [Rubripirellula sp.]MDC0287863.1 tetratricopeptide repeat protein [Rubripirellula sp.]
MKIRLLFMVGFAFLADASCAVAEEDQVYVNRGASVRGKVGEVSPVLVSVAVGTQKQNVSTNDIRVINFGDEPPALRQGRARAVAGKYDVALEDLKKVDASSISRPILKLDLQFYLALCQGRQALKTGAGKTEATEAMLAFVRSAASSNHFFQAADLLGDLAVSQGDFENAVKYYGGISSKAPWTEDRVLAQLAEADARVKQGRFADAQKRYESILTQKADTPEVKRLKLLAEVGRGKCLAETATVDEGINALEKLIAENDSADTELFGRAYNALGDCLQRSNKPKDALMAYLHVDILFYGDSETHAEALYQLSKLWQVAKNQDRAAVAGNLLKQRYAGSVWAAKQ